MSRERWVASGWAAIPLAPIAIPLAILVQLLPFKKTVDRTPPEVAKFIREFVEGTEGEWDWDEFENVPITDPALEAIRLRAVAAGPRSSRADADFERLRECLRQAEAIRVRQTPA